MYTYQLINDPLMGKQTNIVKRSDNAFIPFDPDNTDFVEYQKWLDAGNTPTPAEEQS